MPLRHERRAHPPPPPRLPGEPFFNFCHRIALDHLWAKDVEAIVVRPMRQLGILTAESAGPFAARIADFTAGHPYLVQDVCERSVRLANEKGGSGATLSESDLEHDDNIWETIKAEIDRAAVVIGDFTGYPYPDYPNPNVVTEFTRAELSSKPTILITQTPESLCFDWKHRRAIVYTTTTSGLARLRVDLARDLRSLAERDLAGKRPTRNAEPALARPAARRIAVVNFKGGVGKTTLTLNLAATLANRGHRVLLADLDAQASLTFACLTEQTWASWEQDYGTLRSLFEPYIEGSDPDSVDIRGLIVHDVIRGGELKGKCLVPGLDLLPSHIYLGDTDLRLAGYLQPTSDGDPREEYSTRACALSRALKRADADYDFVFFDCPPNLYLVAQNGLLASDAYLIPTIPDHLSVQGIRLLRHHINKIFDNARKIEVSLGHLDPRPDSRFLGIVLTRVGRSCGAAGQGIMKAHLQEIQMLANLEKNIAKLIFPYDFQKNERASPILTLPA